MNLKTPKATKIAGIGAMLVVAVLGWLVLVGPATSAIGETNSAVADAQDRTMLLTTQLSSLQVQADDLSVTREAADGLGRMWPATADQPGFFDAVSGAASSAGYRPADVTTLSPSAPIVVGADGAVPDDATATTDPATTDPAADPAATEPATGWAVQTVSMSVTGGYDQAITFLAKIEDLPRSILVRSIAVSSDSGDLVLTVNGLTFVASPVVEPDPAGGTTADATTDDGSGDTAGDTAGDTVGDTAASAADGPAATGPAEGDGQSVDPDQQGLAEAAEDIARDDAAAGTADGS